MRHALLQLVDGPVGGDRALHDIQQRTGLAISSIVKQLWPLRTSAIVIDGVAETFPPEIPGTQPDRQLRCRPRWCAAWVRSTPNAPPNPPTPDPSLLQPHRPKDLLVILHDPNLRAALKTWG